MSLPYSNTEFDFEFAEKINDEDLFLLYQREIVASTSVYALTVVEKSRRIGATWALAGDCALEAARTGGQDQHYIGPSLDMAREFIETVAGFAKAFALAADAMEEKVFKEFNKDTGESKDITVFRIRFASGHTVQALSSHPRSLRGRKGRVIIDEAGFHDDLNEVLKAAIALTIWGATVVVISTHNGENSHFNQLINEIRSGRRAGNVVRISFDDAVAQGLGKRICLVKGQEWSEEWEKDWIAEIRKSYGEAAKEELDVIPSSGSGSVFSYAQLEKISDENIPVVRWTGEDDFLQASPAMRKLAVDGWIKENLAPIFKARIKPNQPSYMGEDFARKLDRTSLWPIQVNNVNQKIPVCVVELGNIPHNNQWQMVKWIIENLPRFSGAAFDAGGNGEWLAEQAQEQFGSDLVEAIKFSQSWYRENMPAFAADITEENSFIPKDREILDDHRSLVRQDGIIKPPSTRTNAAGGGKRHGDSAIAHALANYASRRDPLVYTGCQTVKRETAGTKRRNRLSTRPNNNDVKSNRHKGTY